MTEEDRAGAFEEDRVRGIEPAARSAAFEVVPVRRRRKVAGWLVAAGAIALAAFVAGLAIASPGDTALERDPAVAVAPQRASASPQDTAAAPGTGTAPGTGPAAGVTDSEPEPSSASGAQPDRTPVTGPAAGGTGLPAAPASTAQPGSSPFLAGFEPAAVVATVDAAQACETRAPLEKGAPRTRADGPRLTFQRSWLVFCRIPPADRQAFLVDLFQALRPAIPAETYSYGTTRDGAGNALFPYADRPLAGTVAVHADAAGKGLAIVVVVEEWRTG